MTREEKEMREKISYLSRYMSSISPKLKKYKELEDEMICLKNILNKRKPRRKDEIIYRVS